MVADARDPREILGVAREASAAEVRRAYRSSASRWHPDRAGGDRAKFDDVCWAYEVLSDPERAAAHDAGQPFLDDSEEFVRREGLTEFLRVLSEAVCSVDGTVSALSLVFQAVDLKLRHVDEASSKFGAMTRRLEQALECLVFPASDGADPAELALSSELARSRLAERRLQRERRKLRVVSELASSYSVDTSRGRPQLQPSPFNSWGPAPPWVIRGGD